MILMGRRVGAWLLALVVVGGLGVGAVLVARSSGSREPPVLELATVAVSSDAAATAQARHRVVIVPRVYIGPGPGPYHRHWRHQARRSRL